jgi:hypothetical protein
MCYLSTDKHALTKLFNLGIENNDSNEPNAEEDKDSSGIIMLF